MATLPSSATVADWATAVGASFTGVTVIETVAATVESTVPSFTLKVKLSEPLKFELGV